jgi:dipeptide transport system permease protein
MLGAAAALVLSLGLGVPLGVWAAARQGSPYDRVVSWICAVSAATPTFWLGLLLIWLFSLQLGWCPVSGRLDPVLSVEPVTGFLPADALLAGDMPAFASALHHLILPALTLAAAPFAMTLRVTRAAMIETLGENYIRAARARGFSASCVLWRHAVPNAAGAVSA